MNTKRKNTIKMAILKQIELKGIESLPKIIQKWFIKNGKGDNYVSH